MVYDASERFHQVTYKGFAFKPQPMIDSNIQVEPKHSYETFEEVEKDGIANIQRYIHDIAFYPWVPSFPLQILGMWLSAKTQNRNNILPEAV